MPNPFAKTPWPLTAWIFVCAYFNCVGWILSALHCLNTTGYAIAVLVGIALFVWMQKKGVLGPLRFNLHRQQRRFRRFFPAAFFILASLAFIGGAIHAPVNYDALAYRVPRVLHWLSDGEWHWIHTTFHRLNTRSCGHEWLSAPMIALLKSTRFLFLIDFASYLLLPGLFYSVLTRLGFSSRMAWHWMWILPTGYCYLLQAGSISNDMFGAVFALASVDLGLRARASGNLRPLWLSILAVALLTGSKASNIPLALPWFVAVWPVLGLLRKQLAVTFAVACISALVSFLPMAALNYKNCGDWTGQAAEHAVIGNGDALLHIGHNIVAITIQNFAPPVFPLASTWNRAMIRLIPEELSRRMALTFEPSEAQFQLAEMQVEEVGGVGFGISSLVLLTFLTKWLGKRTATGTSAQRRDFWIYVIMFSAWISILPFFIKAGWSTTARLSTPYYGLMLPLLLLPRAGQRPLYRRRWWQWCATIVFFLAGLLVVISPARPLWPAKTVLSAVHSQRFERLIQRARTVYETYGSRSDAFAPVLDTLPLNANVVGLITRDDPEATLWKPFGTRRFRHVIEGDSKADLLAAGIKYVLVGEDKFPVVFTQSFEQWLASVDGKVVQKVSLTLRAKYGPVNWLLVEVDANKGNPVVP